MTEEPRMADPALEPGASGERPAPLRARALSKHFVGGDGQEIPVIRDVDLTVESGEAVSIIGSSGAGKSTLLHILGALDRPTAGEVRLGDRAAGELGDQELAELRNRHVGFVFQFHHLLREFTALENVMMPALVGGTPMEEAKERARELLDAVGVRERESHKPRQLSGGEQQRVAVARALVNRPLVLLADEPSGNLDNETSAVLHDLLFDIRRERALSMVLVTHNLELARRAERVLLLEGGGLHPASSG